ncbi:hypothetical protein V5N11_034035 [Cardamine amara subsp. amara]|uniref:NYN domain-containing protein n=1 Tax=Cardamine amara subsp. amara TaxID=228776 RepID=A0ABD0ZLW0_CARAN
MMNATQEQAVVETSVFWDIKTCPVPPECDAGVVGRCINRYLKKLGYYGPLTSIAVGLLTDVPDDVLRRISSTGIVLNHVPLGSIGILRSMNAWKQTYPPPTNMMLISSDESILPRIRHSCGYNIFRLFPYDSTNAWKRFLLQDSGEDKCSVTPESAYWLCSACPDHLVSQGYEKFTTHLSSLEHQIKANRVELEAVAETWVVWDIKGCPVPPGCDVRRVRPCIEQYLKDFGYSGALTITAVGLLTDVDEDILRAVSSTGIILRHMEFYSGDISSVLYLRPRPSTYYHGPIRNSWPRLLAIY